MRGRAQQPDRADLRATHLVTLCSEDVLDTGPHPGTSPVDRLLTGRQRSVVSRPAMDVTVQPRALSIRSIAADR